MPELAYLFSVKMELGLRINPVSCKFNFIWILELSMTAIFDATKRGSKKVYKNSGLSLEVGNLLLWTFIFLYLFSVPQCLSVTLHVAPNRVRLTKC